MINNNKCILCESTNFKKIFTHQNSKILRCLECNFIFQRPLPTETQLKDMYQEEALLDNPYFDGLKKNYDQNNPAVLVYKKELKFLADIIKPGKVLDIGCAYGVFLDIARNFGWQPYGIEISEKMADYARSQFNLPVIQGTIAETSYENNFFQLITLWDVIEHLSDPLGVLEKCYKALEKYGLILIFTININSLIAKLAHLSSKAKTFLYDCQHINFFSYDTLSALLRKVGFKEIILIEKLPIKLKRWHSKKIPFIIELSTNILDILSIILRMEYRIVVIAKKN